MLGKIFRLLAQIYIAFFAAIPTEIGVRLRYFAYRPLFKKTNGFFRIDSGVTIVGFKYISLGANAVFKKNSYIYAHSGGGELP